ncbi:MAG: pantetheine-phosphate adenylyltransferase [Bacilli bacterium]|nr:pantetheine-phosphate adenylyltransferase [Bacilli bacterium]
MKIAVYPGSFDPITNGHLDILKRALAVFDKVIVLVAYNKDKKCVFSVNERIEMIKDAVKELKNVEVDSTDGLTLAYAKKAKACCLVRGLRAVTDFEYEFKMAEANHYIDKSIEEVFFMSNSEYSFISSSMVNELHLSGVKIDSLVPASVIKAYKNK